MAATVFSKLRVAFVVLSKFCNICGIWVLISGEDIEVILAMRWPRKIVNRRNVSKIEFDEGIFTLYIVPRMTGTQIVFGL